MKIVILNGGPRKEGSTAMLLNDLKKGVEEGSSVEWIDVYDLNVTPCRGCLGCRPDKECALKEDDAHRVGRKIKEADALVIGCPTYTGNITGPLKTLFDRVLTSIEVLPENSFPTPINKGRKAAIVVTSACPAPFHKQKNQSWGTVNSIKAFLKAGGYDIRGTVNLPGANLVKKVNVRYIQKARKLGRELS